MTINLASSKLLVIDDNPANLQVLHKSLSENNYEVLVDTDALNALEQIEFYPPDLILLDVIMPKINGFQVCNRLKKNPVTKDIPVIFMTALNDTENEVRGLKLGAVDYITKPFQVEEVLARINLHLKLREISKQLEIKNRELNNLNANLEKKVGERTLQLSQSLEQLKKTQEELKDSNLLLKEYSLDLEQKVKERTKQLEQEIIAKNQAESALQNILIATARFTGQDFFPVLVKNLAVTLGVRYAIVSQVIEDEDNLETLSIWCDNQFSPNFKFNPNFTPCQKVLETGTCFYPDNVQNEFPEDVKLSRMNVQSYLGMALYDSQQHPIGSLCVLDDKPILNINFFQNILTLFATRAATELERKKATEQLEKLNQELELRVQERTLELNKNQELLRLTIENTPIGIATCNLQGYILTANKAFSEMIGYCLEELQTKTFQDITHPDDRSLIFDKIQELLNEEASSFKVEKRYLHRNGSVIFAVLRVGIIRDSQANPLQFVAEIEDITNDRLIQEKLRLQEKAIAASNNGIFIIKATDLSYPIIYVNPAFEKITGYQSTEIIGNNYFLSQETNIDLEALFKIKRAIIKGQTCKLIIKNLRKNKDLFWSEVNLSPIYNEMGNITHYMGIKTDVTEQKQAEEILLKTLRELEFQKFALDESAIVAITDNQGIITYVNDKFCQISQYSHSELLGNTHSLINSHYHDSEFFKNMWQTIISGNVWKGEIRNKAKDNSYYWVDTTIVPLMTEDNKPFRYLAIRFDITETKEAKKELEQSNRLLNAISKAQSSFIQSSKFSLIFTNLLTGLVNLTNAKIGFISSVCYSETYQPYLEKIFVKINHQFKLNNEINQNLSLDKKQYLKIKNIFEQVIIRNKQIIINNFVKQNSPNDSSLSFLAIPLKSESKIVGVLGILDYFTISQSEFIKYIQPFLNTCANIIEAHQNNQKRITIEQALKQQLTAVEATIDGIAILNSQQQFIYINQAHLKLFGYDKNTDLLGKTWEDLYFSEEINRFKQNVFPILSSKKYWQGEAIAKRRDGSTFPEDVSLTLVDGGTLVCVCRDISDRKKAENQLKSSLQEKEILLKEIHHRVKNNLLVISSLLDLQTDYIKDTAMLNILEDSQKRIYSMALIHEKLYRSKNFDKIELGEYLQNLVKQIYASCNIEFQDIKLHFELQQIYLNIETVTPCGLIVNELVANSFEHGFTGQQSGNLWLKLAHNNSNEISIIIRDDGKGFPSNIDFTNTESLGLQLVCLLIEQLEGHIELETNQGTTFKLTFSELNYQKRI